MWVQLRQFTMPSFDTVAKKKQLNTLDINGSGGNKTAHIRLINRKLGKY